MRTLVIRQWARCRTNGELGHALFRCAGALAFGAYLAMAARAGRLPDAERVLIGVGAYAGFSVLWLAVVAGHWLPYRWRSVAAVVLDQSMFALALYFAGGALGPVAWAPVVMVIGNGLRNGPLYAHLSTASAVVAIPLAVAYSPAWQRLPLTNEGVEGMLLAIIVLPLYVQLLLVRIERARQELSRRAVALEAAARTDPLTGILNRAGFFAALETLRAMARAGADTAVVMLLDLDGFKAINDQCGHAAGDAVLRQVAQRVAQCLRSVDTVARIGGDEFAVALLPGTSAAKVEHLARGLIDAVASVRVPGQPELQVGASIGICHVADARAFDPDAVMAEADRLMYQAKRSGKNCYRCSPLAAPAFA